MAMSKDPMQVHRKIAILGAREAGKTALVHSFVSGVFLNTYDPTIETVYSKTIKFRKVHVSTDIVDTAGIDEYSRFSRNASIGNSGFVLVFSICQRKSFDQILTLNQSLLQTLGDTPDVPRILVGTMSDLEDQRQVPREEAQRLADTLGVPYIECSSMTGVNVSEVFKRLMREIEKGDGLLPENSDTGCTVL